MTRSRSSARTAGTRFETTIARTLAAHVDDRIERRTRTGSKDRGDLSGWRYAGMHIVAELKDCSRFSLGEWIDEAEVERGNADAQVGLVISKRRLHGDPLDQYVHLTLRDLVTLLTRSRPS